jgi:GNAT superfamily N-acetyltransferase
LREEGRNLGFRRNTAPSDAIAFCMDVRPRIDSDLDGCEDVAAVVRAIDGYPPHLPHQLRQFVASQDALGAWVADDDGQIVGHVALNPTSSDEVIDLACAVLQKPAAALGVIARLFVAPSRRGQGTGGRLLRAATAAAVSRGLVPILDVGTHFTPAIAMYEKHGWTRLGAVTVTFGDRDLPEFVYVGPGQLVGPAKGRAEA